MLQAIAARMNGFQEFPYLSVNHGSAVPLALSIKLQLYRELTAAGMTRANLQQVAGWPKTKADRMFDPNHESKLAQVETAF
ncbi:hypothetical protein SM764_04130 [Pseudophaeobacter sp. 1A16562]|uniref:hypothetical protein n=1 Tax=Pseudophaeobacter sp. 1A16562 TaxID=3098143 RepID=UPI0034D6C624